MKNITRWRRCVESWETWWAAAFTSLFYLVLTFSYSWLWIKGGHFHHLGFSSLALRRLLEPWYWRPRCSFPPLLMLFLNSAFERQHRNHRCCLGFHLFTAVCRVTKWEKGRGDPTVRQRVAVHTPGQRSSVTMIADGKLWLKNRQGPSLLFSWMGNVRHLVVDW